MINQVTKFENNRWQKKDQAIEFRHKAALEMVDQGPVLDIGCGDGLFLRLLAKKGLSGEGIDISPKAIEKCQIQGLKAQILDFTAEDLPYSDNTFGTVSILDVLEHVYQPTEIVSKAKRIANQLVISVPNFNSLPARLQVLFGKTPQNNQPNKGHVYWFNYAIIKKFLAAQNLKIITIKTHTFWQNKFLIGPLMKFLLNLWPNLFALSFVIKVKKHDS